MAESFRLFSDPIHGNIKFDKNLPVENLALRIIDTKAFNRTRNIKALGFKDMVFPSANHTRFSHMIGSFHIARQICDIYGKQGFGDESLKEEALIAALCHDIGHTEYSHVFERIDARIHGGGVRHEDWTRKIILEDPELSSILESYQKGFSKRVAGYFDKTRLTGDDLYSGIVSGTIDADRLDYMMRDRFMCNYKGSAVNTDRILDSLQVFVHPETGKPAMGVRSKAVYAIEEFLNSRADLYTQVYWDKTELGMTLSLLDFLEKAAAKPELLDDKHSPFENYLKGDMSLENYLEINNGDIDRMVRRMSRKDFPDKDLQKAAGKVWQRDTYKQFTLTLSSKPNKKEVMKTVSSAKKILGKIPGFQMEYREVRAYDPQKSPIHIIDRNNKKIFELSQISESRIQNKYRRITVAFIPNEEYQKLPNEKIKQIKNICPQGLDMDR